jgi:precorrin-6B methylase 2
MLSVIDDALELQPGHILVDMGCGPALESKVILKKMENKIRVIGK